MSDQSILYIEDEEDYQMLVQRILGKVGFEITIAGTGEEGMAALKRQRPSLLILDINLPDTSGYAICSALRQDPAYADLPILMLTVRRRPEEWLKGFSSGADDYVSKPLNPPELVERVKNCLEGRRKATDDHESAEYQLIQAAVTGNRPAFEVLIQQYRERLIDSLRASGKNMSEAEDLVSGAFAKAFEQLKQFRGQSSFYTWLYRIAQNESSHQRRGRRPGVSLDEISGGDESALPVVLAEPDRVSEDISQRVLQAQLQRAVAFVPKPYRQVLKWHYMRGLSYDALARKLKIPPGTVMSRLFKAKQLLRKSWETTHSR